MEIYRIGIDIGSTTMKVVALDQSGKVLFHKYVRHQAKIREYFIQFLNELRGVIGEAQVSLNMTGSVGMGVAEYGSLPFVQEVIAATRFIQTYYPGVSTLIDIGGEDAKVVFLKGGQVTDLRMNGNCAGGTGAFIDQMAILLGVSVDELNDLALHSTQLYPIASRCGVFCKTDIQNLVARNVSKEDIAASIFHAVAVQTVVTLAHGCDIKPPILLCGGPFTFIPALRIALERYLKLKAGDLIMPERSNLIPAYGCALSESTMQMSLPDLIAQVDQQLVRKEGPVDNNLRPLFRDPAEYAEWKSKMEHFTVPRVELSAGYQEATMGIDSGSTTTKIVVLDALKRMLFSYYSMNSGNPIGAVENGLQQLAAKCKERGADLHIKGCCTTGYGEDLIKAAFRMDGGVVETMAHYVAAKNVDPDVTFILDIGGQDMKAIFVNNGVIDRIEINEACSSGCGSFISTFAQSLDCRIEEFARMACFADRPCDLGTRCTVFMNSKVKQVLREGASMADIAAGLSYSVIKNCLYKVLRLKNPDELGPHIVVQGGTMLNDSIVRGLEILTGKQVSKSNCPELMGALGCALYARSLATPRLMTVEEMIGYAQFTAKQLHCRGCENQCTVTRYQFGNQNAYYSGNRCEKVFTNRGKDMEKGLNVYEEKQRLLFDRIREVEQPTLRIGIPRCLNLFEEFPFWNELFTDCGIQVELSDPSVFGLYECCANKVMSDNICFPAKLVHSHIENLIEKKVDRIFMPFVVFEKMDDEVQNSYNCPIVTGYSQVVRSVQSGTVPIDSPTFSFKDRSLLLKQCRAYLSTLGIDTDVVEYALQKAEQAYLDYVREIVAANHRIWEEGRSKGRLIVLLAGRPYHTDPLIQHKVSEMIASLGAYVISDDIVRDMSIPLDDVQYLSQWAFTNRIMKAAKWAAHHDSLVQYMQLTSFGCGPDAFLLDEVRTLLKRYGKNLTLLKIDDVTNIGSLKLRVRSLMESMQIGDDPQQGVIRSASTLPPYTESQRKKKIIMPYFTPFISPLIPSLMKAAGYDADNLPMSDQESCDWGLKYSNNEVCYPATLIVGDVIKAFKTGRYDPDETCVAMSQTGGQCRASNYMSLIKRALAECGYTNTPVISVSLGSGIQNDQPGFKIHWLKLLPLIIAAVIYSDSIAKLYYAAVTREREPGQAAGLRDFYLESGKHFCADNEPEGLLELLPRAAHEFNEICETRECPKVGIVGEIFLKFNPFAHKNIMQWLVDRGIEVQPPLLMDFFMQNFVNMKANHKTYISYKSIPDFISRWIYRKVQRRIEQANDACRSFRYFRPFESIFVKAEKASEIISLNAQFGEGWLIAGEMASFNSQGISHVVSLQPFGCIANHIVEKGIEKRIKTLFPDMRILSLDFDSSVSDVNITNRLLLFVDDLLEGASSDQQETC